MIWFSPTLSLRTLPARFRQAASDNLTSGGIRATEAYPGQDNVSAAVAEISADAVVLFGRPAECAAMFETIVTDGVPATLRVAVARSANKSAEHYGADAVATYTRDGKVDSTVLAPQLRELLDPLIDGLELHRAYSRLVPDNDEVRLAARALVEGDIDARVAAAKAAGRQRGASNVGALLLALNKSATSESAADEELLREELLNALSWHECEAVYQAFVAAIRHESGRVLNAIVGIAWRQEQLVRSLDKLASALGDSRREKAILDRLYRIEAAL